MNAAARDAEFFGARTQGLMAPAVALAPYTWFRVGGPAEALVQPAHVDDLAAFVRALPAGLPVFAIGAGSNLIVRDGGIAGAVVRLGKAFATIAIDGDAVVVGGSAADALVARRAAEAGLSGLEFLAGIPGTIGGAVAMNAGAYGGEIAHILDWAEIVTRTGEIVRLPAEAFAFGYRAATGLPPESVVVRARLRATAGDAGVIGARLMEIRARREATQPVKERTGGSTFRNPAPHESSFKAWELIDQAGCRGLAHEGAAVSALHTNFLVNTGSASAAAIETLGETVRTRVRDMSGIDLHWEIRRVGIPA